MRVEFYKAGEGRLCGWVAAPPKRRPFQGATMAAGRDLPHDLAQLVIERELGATDGFWGLLARGAWFASVPGRRPTEPGRALARAHQKELAAVEATVNAHYFAWRRGERTPVGPALDAMHARWRGLVDGERLVLAWPMRRHPARALPDRGQDQRRLPSRGVELRAPKFPGYRACLAMMRKHNPQTSEDGFYLLLPHAAEHIDALLLDFQAEQDHGLRCWLLELIGAARSTKAFALLREQLLSSDEAMRYWGIHGLRALNTPEARQVLFDAGLRKDDAGLAAAARGPSRRR